METGMSLPEEIRRRFGCDSPDVRMYSPLALAFVGDCVYDLLIRTLAVERANVSPNTLHKRKSQVVCAVSQAACADALLAELTPEELAIYKRGRNAHSHSTAKNAPVTDYRKATGLEALYGFLYLTDRMDRILELVQKSLELTDLRI